MHPRIVSATDRRGRDSSHGSNRRETEDSYVSLRGHAVARTDMSTLPASTPGSPRIVLYATRGAVEVDGQLLTLSGRLCAMLELLAEGRVVTRSELARAAGLEAQSSRRCESLLVELRKIVGPDSIRNLRRRGWIMHAPMEVRYD